MTSAGTFDKDCELGFYTEIWFEPPKCSGCDDHCADEQPTPGMSFIEFDINKHTTDILGLYRYLNAKVAKANKTNPEMLEDQQSYPMLQPSPPG